MRRRLGFGRLVRPSLARCALPAAVVCWGAVAGCASVSPSPKADAIEVAPGGLARLRAARTVWVGRAVRRTGDPLADRAEVAGLAAAEAASRDGGGEVDDTSDALGAAVRKLRRLELAPTRDRADLVLYFVAASRLHCYRCRQPPGLWYWWGFVTDREGGEIASLHGETAKGDRVALRRFVAGVKRLRKRSRGGR